MRKLIRSILLLLLSTPVCLAQTAAQSDLKTLTLEELLDIDITAVSKRPESLRRTAAAVSILTGEDLRRAGVTNVPEALRLIPGMHVGRFSAGSWAISSRGFSSNSANKLLVLLDGRPVYSPIFSGTFWDIQDLVIDDIARIEVVRGPGATLWGANAVNGVINILTKTAHQTKSNLVVLYGGGADDLGATGLRTGGGIGPDASYRLYGKYFYRDETKLANGGDAKDSTRIGHAGFRIDAAKSSGQWTLMGDTYNGLAGINTRQDAKVLGGHVMGRWIRKVSNASELQVQTYFERNYRRVPLQSDFNQRSFDIDVQHHLVQDRHNIVWGGGYRWNHDESKRTIVLSFTPEERSYPLLTAFAQDEISFANDKIRLIFGSKFEHNDYSGFEFQPSVRTNILLKSEQMLWTAVSRAVRTPTRFDSDIRFSPPGLVISGNPEFNAERLIAYEVGYRAQPYGRLTFDIATFINDYDDVRSVEVQPISGRVVPLPVLILNNANARTYGGEASFNIDAYEWLRFSSTYAYMHKRMSMEPGTRDLFGGTLEGNDPKHQFHVRSSADLSNDIEVDSTLRFVDKLPNPLVPRYLELDTRIGWTPTPSLDFSIVGRNLLDKQHPESGPPSPLRSEVQRNIYGRITIRF